MRQPNVDILHYWWEFFNDEEFNGKLREVGLGFTKSRATHGYFEHYPGTNRKSYIRIARTCLEDEELLKGTILHEMIHQYQFEVLERKCNHDAVFTSIARRLERKYKFEVR